MVSNATVASTAISVIAFSIAAIGSLVTWAWVGAALRKHLVSEIPGKYLGGEGGPRTVSLLTR